MTDNRNALSSSPLISGGTGTGPVAEAMSPAGFQDLGCGHDVHRDVVRCLTGGRADAGAPREVDHAADRRACTERGTNLECAVKVIGAAAIGFEERVLGGRWACLVPDCVGGCLDRCQIGVLAGGVVVRREGVDCDDIVTTPEECLACMAANEPGGSGDDDRLACRGLGNCTEVAFCHHHKPCPATWAGPNRAFMFGAPRNCLW